MPSSPIQLIRRRRARKRRLKDQRTRARTWLSVVLGVLGLVVGLPFVTLGGLMGLLYAQAAAVLPTPAQTLFTEGVTRPTELYDRSGRTLLFAVSDPLGEARAWQRLDDMPVSLLQATLLMEDDDFLDATRWQAFGTVARLWQYVLGVPLPLDNSITGRLARNALLPLARDSGLDPDLLELVFVSELNRLYTPRALLEWHLNTNNYGSEAYGIQAAAWVYLGKRVDELTLDEAALLAAIPAAPQFNPIDDLNAARGRQTDLLRAMFVRDFISQEEFDRATSRLTPVRSDLAQVPRLAPEFSLFARQQARTLLDRAGLDGAQLIARGGLRITTTLDVDLYQQSRCLLEGHLAQLAGDIPANVTPEGIACVALAYLPAPETRPTPPPNTGALLVLDVAGAEILSMVGDVQQAAHQPSVMLHPFVYLEGFRSGSFTPATMVYDIPRAFAGAVEGLLYTPQNRDGLFRGPVNARVAMASGLLPPTVGVADTQGLSRVLNTARVLGINTLDASSYDLSLLERGGAVSVLDVGYAYSVLATLGYMQGVDIDPIARGARTRNPVAVLKIAAADGSTLWEYDSTRRALSRTNILGETFSYVLNNLLGDTRTRAQTLGVSGALDDLRRPSASVSGASWDNVDNWAVGYTPQRLAVVHLGHTQDLPIGFSAHAQEGALTLWHALMRYAHERDALPPSAWQRPADVVEYSVCERSGLLPAPNVECPRYTEIFLRQVPPVQTDTFWQVVELNSQTRQLATAFTPDNLRVRSVYFVPPPIALEWWQSNNLPLPPTEYDTVSRPSVLKAVDIFVPSDFAYVGGVVDVRGSIEATTQPLRSFQLAYGRGLNPTQWFSIGEPQTTFRPGTSLGLWDTTGLEGIYTLQLTATFADNSRDTDFVQVNIDNTPPTVRLQVGEPNQIFRYPADRVIPIVAEVTDNLAIQRVEFYHNGQLLGIDTDWPYGFEFRITGAGEETFTATAFDQVGNSSSDTQTIQIRRE